MVKALVENGADVNHFDNISNQTALFYAAREGRVDVCQYLIEHGMLAVPIINVILHILLRM